ncbi:Txe/YoeB family addiction module toxin [Staphylococcus epidermidis]|uniref:Txe/YoeB family addiction module toxin n=1 Tax=Staphylococcus epidermidis TaxID=1282 RepID=UPI0018878F32|nr:Txe/YoeB family addiction module toxin [Staphylococcus epidermidis]MBF2233787.1 Txe/YoeB family addiction module toxin [Staphylococcus epidermidis]MBF2337412.1 Txe/YoeB family addiction module toxin [Staphylococcus epidermidis]MCG1299586.1 Txe/YoeB family addiction module toxin [Staphylococcus epidermidis]MCG2071732.1 Txe/YoeB family addiction module toxin [Staphylococcus epidermidis]MCG2182435.1 Txe/YoeB family addiction module toxin [Staphylococcus epidermidis]
MGSYSVNIHNLSKSDLKKLKHSHLKNNFLDIINTLKIDPYKKSHSFKKLQPKQLEMYSRRINYQHRIVYKVNEQTKEVLILSAWSHYE